MITYRELLWLTRPGDVRDDGFDMNCPSHYRYEPCGFCPGDLDCDECWDREIPYPVIAEAAIESMSNINCYVAEKGAKLYVVEVDMKTQTNWNVRLSEEPKSELGCWFNQKDFRFYIDKEEKDEMAKYKVGDKVRIRKWDDMVSEFGIDEDGDIDCGLIYFNSDMREYCGESMTITSVKNNYYSMKEDDGEWKWTDHMFLPGKRFSKADLKDGMMVEDARHERYLFLAGSFRNVNNELCMDDYDSTLTSYGAAQDDIVKVGYPDYKIYTGLQSLLDHDFSEVIWERTAKKITREEAMDVLREHYGENVVIVK